MAVVFIPSLLRELTGGVDRVDVPGETVRQLIANLDKQYPGMHERLVEDDALKLRIAVAVDGRVTRLGLLQKVEPTSEVHFLPAMAGGTARYKRVAHSARRRLLSTILTADTPQRRLTQH